MLLQCVSHWLQCVSHWLQRVSHLSTPELFMVTFRKKKKKKRLTVSHVPTTTTTQSAKGLNWTFLNMMVNSFAHLLRKVRQSMQNVRLRKGSVLSECLFKMASEFTSSLYFWWSWFRQSVAMHFNWQMRRQTRLVLDAACNDRHQHPRSSTEGMQSEERLIAADQKGNQRQLLFNEIPSEAFRSTPHPFVSSNSPTFNISIQLIWKQHVQKKDFGTRWPFTLW